MNASNPPSNNSRSSLKQILKTRWFNFRRKRFWVLTALLLYTLLGFFLAPLIVKNGIIDLFQQDLGRTAQIEKVEVNPFSLSLRVLGFEVEDKDAKRLIAFKEFYANFQLSSLYHWAWTFSELRLAEPYFFMERFDEADSRLSRLITDFTNSRPAEAEVASENGSDQDSPEESMPRLIIHDLSLSDGGVDLRDNLPEAMVEARLAPINVSIQHLNTLPNEQGKQSVTIQLPNNASLKWGGNLSIAPFASQGELTLENLYLDPAIAYLQDTLPLESLSATLSAHLLYNVQMGADSQPDVDISDIEIELNDLAISGLTPQTEFVNIQKISLSGGVLRYPQQTLQFSSFKLENPRLEAWLKENGELSLSDLAPAASEVESDDTQIAAQPSDDDKLSWQLGINEFQLNGGQLMLRDTSIKPVAAVDVTGLQISLSGLSTQPETEMPFELTGNLAQGGSFNVDGTLKLIPQLAISSNISTKDLPLALGQPYIQQFAHLEMKNGVLNSNVEIALADDQGFTAKGSASIPQLEIFDSLNQQNLLSWEMLDIDQFSFDQDANSLRFSQLVFERLFGRLDIHENKATNLSTIMIQQADDIVEENAQTIDMVEEDAQTTDIVIGDVRIKDSSMDFSDFSLPLPFATHIISLNGNISTIDTGSDTPANIKLEGQVDEYGLARINGSMNTLDPVRHTDVSVEFRNLLMSNLSPYTVEFAGRSIDQGKLDLDLGYVIEKGLMQGNNKVVLSDLVLGEKADDPEATSLPLGLAVGLLKDANGVIHLDLPVEGDINNPEFQIGSVIWKAFSGIIGKIVSAPFRLLGKLIGVDSEEFGEFEFLAGRADLTPPELEKIVQLKEALQQRPELVVEISGVSDRSVDTIALKKAKLRAVAKERLGEEFSDSDERAMMLDEKIRTLVEEMFSERFPDVSLADMKAEHTVAPASDPEGKPEVDQLAYATALWNQLLAVEVVSDQNLTDLANARAETIRSAFLESGQFAEKRIVIGAPKEAEAESENGEWVKLELGIASD